MSFLAPLFLFGGLAVALPVLFHLIRRTTRERTVFSSLMFLLPTPPRLTRRSRLEHLLLLLLRCTVLCLLALGFARPFLKRALNSDATPRAARRLVLLVDTSASMRRASLWADARARADAVLRGASPGDHVALFSFDRQAAPALTFEQWDSAPVGERTALALGKLASLSPGWSATHLGSALITAAEALADTAGQKVSGPGQIIVLTDFQQGCHLEPLQGFDWPRGVTVSVEILKPKRTGNAALQLVTDADESDPPANAGVRVRVTNAADSKHDQFQLGWARAENVAQTGSSRSTLDAPRSTVYAPAGQSRIVAVPAPAAGTAWDRIVLQGDEEDFDNTVYVLPPEILRQSVLYIGSQPERDPHQPLYFLGRAFQPTRRQAIQVLVRPPDAPTLDAEARAAALLVVAEALPEGAARRLHDLVAAGQTLLCALTTETAGTTLARMLGLEHVAVEEAHPGNYAMLAEIDFRHPLFAPFADPRFSDFTAIHFWRYRRLDAAAIPGARVLAKFDSGAPALLEVPVGKGRLLVLTSGWQPEDSQLALSTKFVPLLYSMLEQSGAGMPMPMQYHVGDSVPLAPTEAAANSAATIRAPDGASISITAGQTRFSQTTMPGIYTFVAGTTSRRFAVNLDAAESRTTPLSIDELERLGAPVARQAVAPARQARRQVMLQNSELEGHQKLWRWFILGTIVVLLIETWLAARTTRRMEVAA